MIRKVAVLLSLISLSTACRSGTPSTEGSLPSGTTPVQPVIAPPPITKNFWRLVPKMASRQYQANSVSSLELAGTRDSVVTGIRLTLNSQPGDTAIIFSGTVDSISILSGPRIGSSRHTTQLIPFAGRLNQNSVSITAPSRCNNDGISLELMIPHLLFQVPRQQITSGYTWADSTTTSTCYGSIPVVSTVVHNYRVVDESVVDGRATILLGQTERTRSQGAGSQEQHRVEIESAGSGSAQIWIDSTNGQLIKSISESAGTVTVIVSGRRQVFNQGTRITIASR